MSPIIPQITRLRLTWAASGLLSERRAACCPQLQRAACAEKSTKRTTKPWPELAVAEPHVFPACLSEYVAVIETGRSLAAQQVSLLMRLCYSRQTVSLNIHVALVEGAASSPALETTSRRNTFFTLNSSNAAAEAEAEAGSPPPRLQVITQSLHSLTHSSDVWGTAFAQSIDLDLWTGKVSEGPWNANPAL